MQTQPSTPHPTAGEKLRAFANKLNDGNKLGICSLLLVAGLAVTLAVKSQETTQELSKEKTSEIRTEFKDIQMGRKKILIKPKMEEVAQKNQAAWEYAKSFAIESTDTHIRTAGVIHSIQHGDENPHAVVYILQNAPLPTMMILPKDIFTDEGWEIFLKAKANPDFATKWGFKIPDTLGVGTTPGNGTPIHDPKPEAPKPFTLPPTMPVERTITDTKGRALEGTIISKTAASISFKPKGTSKAYDIELDMLSADDQAYIASLVDKKSVKPTVLFLAGQDYEESQELRTWLTNNGFDVILGFMSEKSVEDARKRWSIPVEQKAIAIVPFTLTDPIDVIWIHRFSPEDRHENSYPALVAHRNKTDGVVVIPTHSRLAKKDRFISSDNYYKGSPMLGKEDKAFLKVDENIIFCSNKPPHNTDEKMREKLIEAIKAQLSK